jgi:hypothetical protein
MLPKQLHIIQEYLESLTSPDENQKELLNELNFIDVNEEINLEFTINYTVRKKLFESFSVAPSNCPACGKKI